MQSGHAPSQHSKRPVPQQVRQLQPPFIKPALLRSVMVIAGQHNKTIR